MLKGCLSLGRFIKRAEHRQGACRILVVARAFGPAGGGSLAHPAFVLELGQVLDLGVGELEVPPEAERVRDRAAADPGQLGVIRSQIEAAPGVTAVLDLLTMHLGPDHLIIAAKVAFDDNLSADTAEDVADAIDARLSAQLPVIPHVFLDPTQLPSHAAMSGGRQALPDRQRQRASDAGEAEHDPCHVVVDDTALQAAHDSGGKSGARLKAAPQHGHAPPVQRDESQCDGHRDGAEAGQQAR